VFDNEYRKEKNGQELTQKTTELRTWLSST